MFYRFINQQYTNKSKAQNKNSFQLSKLVPASLALLVTYQAYADSNVNPSSSHDVSKLLLNPSSEQTNKQTNSATTAPTEFNALNNEGSPNISSTIKENIKETIKESTKEQAVNLLDANYDASLDYAPKQSIEEFRASLPKQSTWDKVVNYYNKAFNVSQDAVVTQSKQIRPIYYSNAKQQLSHQEANYLVKPAKFARVSFYNGSKEKPFVNNITGLPDQSTINALGQNNIYTAAALNIQNALDTLTAEDTNGSFRHQYLTKSLITKALQAYGFYNAQVNIEAANSNSFNIALTLGKLTKVGNQSQITIRGMGTGTSVFQELDSPDNSSQQLITSPGGALNFVQYDNAKSTITNLAQANGFFDGKFETNKIDVNRDTNTATWNIDYNTGQRYRLGQITLSEPYIKEELIRNVIKLKSGDYYQENKLSESVIRLYRTKWYDGVQTQNSINQDSKTVDVTYRFLKASPNRIDLSLGYDTAEQIRAQATYDRKYINTNGDNLQADTYLSKWTQKLKVNYSRPINSDPLNSSLNFGFEVNREYLKAYDNYAKNFALNAQYIYSPIDDWQYIIGLNHRRDFWYENDKSQQTKLSYYTLSLQRHSIFTNIKLRVESNKGLTNITKDTASYTQWSAGADHLFTFGENGLKLRAKIAKLSTNDFWALPPTLRLYAGGQNSVRGYGLDSISEYKGIEGVGGLALNEFSIEYQQGIITNLKTAVFVDAGQVSEKFKLNKMNYGAGVGVRYYLPVGYANFDIAYPLKPGFKWNKIHLYLGLTTQFQ